MGITFYIIGIISILYAISMIYINEKILAKYCNILLIKFIFSRMQIIFYIYGLYKMLTYNVGNILNTCIIVFSIVVINLILIWYLNSNKHNNTIDNVIDIVWTILIMLYFVI